MNTNVNPKSSRLSGFHKLNVKDRLDKTAEFAQLGADTMAHLEQMGPLDISLADRLVENVISCFSLPLGIATSMKIDDIDYLIPMATEESSVIAAVSNAARQCYSHGFKTSMSGTEMIAQIQLVGLSNPQEARLALLEKKSEIAQICNDCDPILIDLGGGFKDIEIRSLETPGGTMVIIHIIVDTKDAMGANAVNTMAETLAPYIEQWTGGKVYLRILSNLADRRLARARAIWRCEDIGGEAVRDGIISAYEFAYHDPYRAVTHNKGIMNGISAVTLATGNDTRAIEAGAHAYAARGGKYTSLSHWEITAEGHLAGSIELPMAVGLVGGATKLHPTAKACLQILQVNSAQHLARIIAAVGLAQNFSALKALVTTGIQKGHMSLHAQNIAMMAGALGDEVDSVAAQLVSSGKVRLDIAKQILGELRQR